MVVVGAWRGRVVMVGLKKLAILCVDSEFGLWTHVLDCLMFDKRMGGSKHVGVTLKCQ